MGTRNLILKKNIHQTFKDITTFKKACEALKLDYNAMSITAKDIATVSKASAAMFKLNIIRKALNLGQDLHLTKDEIYYPSIPFVTESCTYFDSDINEGKVEVISKIKSEGKEYYVLGGFGWGGSIGLGLFIDFNNLCYGNADQGFFGCATREIARHFGKYFGTLITDAKYADLVDFEIIEEKYKI